MLRKKQQSYHRHNNANGNHSNNGTDKGKNSKGKVLSPKLILTLLAISFAIAFLYSLTNNDSSSRAEDATFSKSATTASTRRSSSSSSSNAIFQSSSSSYQGVPSHYNIHGQYQSYTQVPLENKKSFFIPPKTPFRRSVSRAFRHQGWRKADTAEEAHLIWDKGVNSSKFTALEKWQRYSYYPNVAAWDEKDKFITGFEKYSAAEGVDIYMIPETYRLNTKKGRERFVHRMNKGGGYAVPWVFKKPTVNNGKGVTMLAPESKELHELVEEQQEPSSEDEDEDERSIVQAYICHELTWTRHQKFDLRFYWMVASLDPLVVLYHDGYVRVGNAVYDESNWDSTTQHLTTHTYLSTEDKGTMEELDDVLRAHVAQHPETFTHQPAWIRDNPLEHVRNQCRQAVAHTVSAFYDKTFGHSHHNYTAENAYGLYGADFIVTDDLHVMYVEAQAGPGMEEEFDFRVELHRSLVRGMIDVVEEIQEKVEVAPQRNVLPLASDTNGWDIVYAGTEGIPKDQHWKYQYQEYDQYRKKQPRQNACDAIGTSSSNIKKVKKKPTSASITATKAATSNKVKKKSSLLREKTK
mmetsp:Transcript_7141/g.10416  ORF Transcript_7141/g.10416 Transcript_7141/m.10416 type:complete len:579 (+) Transcript_7141:145-1881(+)